MTDDTKREAGLMKSIGNVTIREIATGSESFRYVVLVMLDSIVCAISQKNGDVFADHLMRRIFTDGSGCMYDPGDEPAMEISQLNETERQG